MNSLVPSKIQPVDSVVLSEIRPRAIKNQNTSKSLIRGRKNGPSNSVSNPKKNPNAKGQGPRAVDKCEVLEP